MIYFLFKYLETRGFPWLFRYIPTRTASSLALSLLTSLLMGRPLSNLLYRKGIRSKERSYFNMSTISKNGTPTMGGLLLIINGAGGALLWCDLTNPYVLYLLAVGLCFGSMGAFDDWKKVKGVSSDSGLSTKGKYFLQCLIFFGIVGLIIIRPDASPLPPGMITKVYVPFLKEPLMDLGLAYIPVALVFFLIAANSVNLTDGMDGLVTVPTITVTSVLALFAYILGNKVQAGHLLYPFMDRVAEVTVFCGAQIGTLLGFLWFNSFPAEVFMGDTGSLYLGGILSLMSLMLKKEFILVLAGGVFMAEAFTSQVQKLFFLPRGRRLFTMAPLHHVFQNQEMSEAKIVIRFWIVSVLLAVLSVLTIKVR